MSCLPDLGNTRPCPWQFDLGQDSVFQQMEIRTDVSGGARSVWRSMLALNTFGGKTSILILSFEPQIGQQNHTVCGSVTTNPVCGA